MEILLLSIPTYTSQGTHLWINPKMLVSYATKPYYLKIFNDNTIVLDEKQELPLGKATVTDFEDFCFSPGLLAVRGLV